MPDPKKKKKTPAKAATDTGTKATQNRPTPRARRVTENGKGVSKNETTGAGERVSGPENGAGQTFGKTHHYHDSDTGQAYYPGKYTPLVSGGQGGRVTSMPRHSRDPFLEGLNSDLDGVRERPTGRKRRK